MPGCFRSLAKPPCSRDGRERRLALVDARALEAVEGLLRAQAFREGTVADHVPADGRDEEDGAHAARRAGVEAHHLGKG